jgi:hypothetical protein
MENDNNYFLVKDSAFKKIVLIAIAIVIILAIIFL